MEKKILVPVDFEQQSILNLEWAKFYAKYNDAKIILTHIIEESGFLKRMFKQEDFEKKVIEEAKENLKNVAKQYFTDESQFHCTVEKGKAYEEIEDLADEFEPEMIILGRNENHAKGKKYLGSNTLHIINETDFPVVTIYGNQKPTDVENIILLPLDLTKNISEQTTVALEFAKIFGVKIKAVTVNNIGTVSHKSKLLTSMNKVKAFFADYNIECETEIIENETESPAVIVNKIANEINPMIVIIMLREESNFKQFFIGSIAKEIIEECNAPVLSVKPWNDESEENPVFKVVFNPLGIL
ncbi:MAG: universal stress protein [Bacteroidales bacterium]|nr:universal stress protein [Bacteroidales bacterium]